MPDLQKILVIVGPSMLRTPAFRRGVELARRTNAQLFLYMFDYDKALDRVSRQGDVEVARLAKEQFVQERLQWLSAQTVELAEQGLRVECDVLWAPRAHEVILSTILELKADLVIKDLSHEPRLKRIFRTPLDWKLIRLCPASLMLVQPASEALPRKIMASVDTSLGIEAESLNRRIVDTALQFGLYSDAEVHLVHVLPYYPPTASIYGVFDQMVYESLQADQEAFEFFCRDCQVPADRKHWAQGIPSWTVLEIASAQKVDLLVIGSAYHSPIDRLMLGTTAETLVGESDCDVLLVKPANFIDTLRQHTDLDKSREVSET